MWAVLQFWFQTIGVIQLFSLPCLPGLSLHPQPRTSEDNRTSVLSSRDLKKVGGLGLWVRVLAASRSFLYLLKTPSRGCYPEWKEGILRPCVTWECLWWVHAHGEGTGSSSSLHLCIRMSSTLVKTLDTQTPSIWEPLVWSFLFLFYVLPKVPLLFLLFECKKGSFARFHLCPAGPCRLPPPLKGA